MCVFITICVCLCAVCMRVSVRILFTMHYVWTFDRGITRVLFRRTKATQFNSTQFNSTQFQSNENNPANQSRQTRLIIFLPKSIYFLPPQFHQCGIILVPNDKSQKLPPKIQKWTIGFGLIAFPFSDQRQRHFLYMLEHFRSL